MTAKEKIEELLALLRKLGFEGKKLEVEIRQYCKENTRAGFTVKHRITFGKDIAEYWLTFLNDGKNTGYILNNYDIYYFPPVTINHKIINGINTAELELQIKLIDWEEYYQNIRLGKLFDQDEKPIISELRKLVANSSSEGIEIQDKLIYKYVPVSEWPKRVSDQYIHKVKKATFSNDGPGLPNAILAYNHTSGRVDQLYDAINGTGIQQIKNIYLRELLEIYCKRLENFNIEAVLEKDNGVLLYTFPVKYGPDGFEAKVMQVCFMKYPTLEPAICNGIDIADLKLKLEQINWREEKQLYDMENGGESFLPNISSIKEQLLQLAGSEISRDFAHFLMVKYWADSFMHEYVPDDAWKMKGWENVRLEFSIEEDAIIVGNLVSGAPVHNSLLKYSVETLPGWYRVNESAPPIGKLHTLDFIPGASREQIELMLRKLPLAITANIDEIVQSILRGNKVPLEPRDKKNMGPMVISAPTKAGEQLLDLCNPKGMPISFKEVSQSKQKNVGNAVTKTRKNRKP